MAFRESHSCTSLTLNVVIEHKVANVPPVFSWTLPLADRFPCDFTAQGACVDSTVVKSGCIPDPQARADSGQSKGLPSPFPAAPAGLRFRTRNFSGATRCSANLDGARGQSRGNTPASFEPFRSPLPCVCQGATRARVRRQVPSVRNRASRPGRGLSTCRHTAEVAAGPRLRRCIRENRMPWEGWRNSVDHRTHPPTHRAMRAADPRTGLRTVAPGDGLSPPAPAPR